MHKQKRMPYNVSHIYPGDNESLFKVTVVDVLTV